MASYLAAHPKANIVFEQKKIILNDHTIPLDDKSCAILKFRGPSTTHKTFSAAAILQSALQSAEGKAPLIKPEELKSHYILFGFSAPALHDQHNTSVGGKYPGVEVHATFLDNFLKNDFYRPLEHKWEISFSLIVSLLCALYFVNFTSYRRQLFMMVLMTSFPILSAWFMAKQGWYMALVFPTASTSLALFISLIYNYMTEGRQKRFIKHAFRHYLSPHVIEQLINDPDQLKLGGVRREISIFFSDLEGFTTISEKLSPEVLVEVLNEYLSAMSGIILQEQGTIDKYEGDAIIAFWNAPLKVENHATQVVKSALMCQKTLHSMQAILSQKTNCDLKMRIGIHTGTSVVGNMGAKDRFDYTMLGDAVNLAARLEGVNKQFGTYTLISEATKEQMNGAYPVRELGCIAVVGRKEPVRIFEPFLAENFKPLKETLLKFEQGLQLFYEEKTQEALDIFASLEKIDPPSKAYAEKCRGLLENNQSSNGGVWTMTSK
jgi:adenylate cyclase